MHHGVWDNTACERCGDPPLGGGRFCLAHFHELCRDGLDPVVREVCGTLAGYQAHRQRAERLCGGCAVAGDEYRRARREAEAS